MKKQLFPSDIIEHTTESHFATHNKSFRWIYIGLLLAMILALGILPLVSVDITTQSRGPNESSQLQPAIYGQIVHSYLIEGTTVQKGDTLLLLRTDQLDEKITF